MICFLYIRYLIVKQFRCQGAFLGLLLIKFHEIFRRIPEQRNTGFPACRLPEKFHVQAILLFFIITFAAGCGGVSVVGLHPEYPPVEKKTFAVYSDFVEADSLQPTFQWQPFPRPEDNFSGRVHDVTYELRIWTAVPGMSGELRYARDGLELPSHKLEEPLDPSNKYLWSVQAHFMIDGNPRMIEWGLAGVPLRNESVPNLSCFRFKTPNPDKPEPTRLLNF